MKHTSVIITGCGFRPIRQIYRYRGRVSHDSIVIDGQEYKMNIGTATAYYLVKKGVDVVMVSRTRGGLGKIKDGFVALGCNKELVHFVATNVMTDGGIDTLIKKLSKNKAYYWVQSVGIGAGAYKVPNDNIYLPYEKISPDVIKA